jgi:hypothetical protein
VTSDGRLRFPSRSHKLCGGVSGNYQGTDSPIEPRYDEDLLAGSVVKLRPSSFGDVEHNCTLSTSVRGMGLSFPRNPIGSGPIFGYGLQLYFNNLL